MFSLILTSLLLTGCSATNTEEQTPQSEQVDATVQTSAQSESAEMTVTVTPPETTPGCTDTTDDGVSQCPDLTVAPATPATQSATVTITAPAVSAHD